MVYAYPRVQLMMTRSSSAVERRVMLPLPTLVSFLQYATTHSDRRFSYSLSDCQTEVCRHMTAVLNPLNVRQTWQLLGAGPDAQCNYFCY
jgi:hypothetical protein